MSQPSVDTWGHDDLQHDLAGHLKRGDEVLAWENIPLGQAGSVRPDVLSMRKSWTQPNFTAYEIKVTRSDFMSDMTSGKWQNYLEIAGAVVFATPKGLVKRTELPDGTGLIERNDKGWRFAKKPVYERTIPPQYILMKLLMKGLHTIPNENREWFEEWNARKTLRRKFGELVGGVIADTHSAQAKLERMNMTDDLVREKADLERFKREICDVLGMEEWDYYGAINQVRKIRNSFSESERIRSTIVLLERVKEQVESGEKQLKELANA